MTQLNIKKPRKAHACLIIDDPRLCPKYGCLDYNNLMKLMEKHNFFTEIAFIPFNYRFTNKKVIKLFIDNSDRFGICVHGFDHVGNEFGIVDYCKLREKADTALWRMEQFSRRTGLPYDRVMVFPQGAFSSVAMTALRDAGYLAAFNSNITSTDRETPLSEEYKKPFTTYYDLPLFIRRYPSNRNGILEDFKNGRPIILVEHHHAFKKTDLVDTINWVNSLGEIKWQSLSNIVAETCPLSTVEPSMHKSAKSTFKSVVRRIACEIRDNFVQTNLYLEKLYRAIKQENA